MTSLPTTYRLDAWCPNCERHFIKMTARQIYCCKQCRVNYDKPGAPRDFDPANLNSFNINEDERREGRPQL